MKACRSHALTVLFLVVMAGRAHAQAVGDGSIAGTLTDVGHNVLPGVRVTVVSADVSREAITDGAGRFAVKGLPPGRYQVTAGLPGFTSTAGTVALTAAVPRAVLDWSMAIGCMKEESIIIFNSRQAAPLVDTIAHVRVEKKLGVVLRSFDPDCEGDLGDAYQVEVLSAISHGRATGRTSMEVYVAKPYQPLEAGGEYLLLLWPGSVVGYELAFPVVAGRIEAGKDPLGGRRVDDAWKALSKWSRKRP